LKTNNKGDTIMKLSKTYEVWSMEAIELGDTDDRDFEYQDMGFDSLEDMAKEMLSEGCLEPSCNMFHQNIWYTTVDAVEDYRTGEKTYYSFHTKDMTAEQEQELYNLLTK